MNIADGVSAPLPHREPTGEALESMSLAQHAWWAAGASVTQDLEKGIVRVVLSLGYWPIGDSRFEQQMLQRFVFPAFNT